MTRYPEADRTSVHYSPPSGFTRVYMTPERFLCLTPSLCLPDPESDGYIQHFVERIQQGLPLDPPEWALDHHDGRHRATAALTAGVTALPVMVKEDLVDWLIEMGFARFTLLPDTIDVNGDSPWQD